MSNSISTKRTFFGKFGLVSKGALYFTTGLLVCMAAFEVNNESVADTGKSGVFKTIIQQPAGKVMLIILAAGILSYSTWRFLQAFADTENKGKDLKGIGRRSSYAFSGLFYATVSVLAFRFAFDRPDQQSSGTTQNIADKMLEMPYGKLLIIVWAAILAGIAIYQMWYGLSEKFKKHLREKPMDANIAGLLNRAGKVGYTARAIVWLILAVFLVQAALTSNPSKAGDTSAAFGFIKESPFGMYMLAAVGLGFIAYALLNFFRAKYDRFK